MRNTGLEEAQAGIKIAGGNISNLRYAEDTTLIAESEEELREREREVAQSCPTLHDPMDCSPPGSSIHGIFQARGLEWVSMPSSMGSSWPKDQTCISCSSCIAGRFFTSEPLGKLWGGNKNHS